MVTLIDLLSTTYAPIQMTILPYLGVPEVIALTRTCKGFDRLQPILEATAYNIDFHLKKFFDDPKKFRSLLGKYGGLIAGDFARQFFSRSLIDYEFIHIYLEASRRVPATLVNYFDKDGYTLHEEMERGLARSVREGRQTVMIHFDKSANVARVFEAARTTADLNFISWNKAYSLYPYSTFIEKESFLLKNLRDDKELCLNTLADEGLKTKTVSWNQRRVRGDLNETDPSEYDSMTRRRRVGDKSSWTIKLNIEDVQSPAMPDVVVETHTFCLYAPWKYSQNWRVACYQVEYGVNIRHPVLKYQYVILTDFIRDVDDQDELELDDNEKPKQASHYAHRCEELRDRLDELTLLELVKIPTAKRPPCFQQLTHDIEAAASSRGKFKLPDTWTFYDDEVIKFLNKAWAEQQVIDEREEAKRKARLLDPTRAGQGGSSRSSSRH